MRLLSLSAAALLCAAPLLPLPLSAQQVAQNVSQKKALTQADWDRWRSIQNPTLSNDGKWAAYTLQPQVGDGEFVVRATTGTTEYRVPVGYIGRPNNVPGALRPPQQQLAGAGGRGGGGRFGAGGGPASPFSADSRFAFVIAQPNKAQVEAAQRAARGARAAGGPGGAAADTTGGPPSLVIVALADGKTATIAGVRSFRLPKENGKWVVYSVADTSRRVAGDSAARGGPGGGAAQGAQRGGAGRPGAARDRRQYGTAIVLRNLDTGAEQKIDDVLTYTFDDSAKVLAYTVVSRDSTKDGAYIRDLAKGTTQTLLAGRGNYRAFTFDKAQQQFVFTSASLTRERRSTTAP